MSADELQDLEENAERAQKEPAMAWVSITMAFLAVFGAVVTLLGHRAHTEEVVLQAKASDQWAYYQAKNIRENEDQLLADFSAAVTNKDEKAMADFHQKAKDEAQRHHQEKGPIQDEARKLDAEVHTERHRADRYDISEVFLEIGLVITSITLLSGRKVFWYMGIGFAIIGSALAVTAAVIR
ncbi:MAG TPA: DUF4337 domain-containing protein [Candidatus Binatia bacterium]|nr:DUF4337 domain-containing protein [Candidatus Binatia bacterium]